MQEEWVAVLKSNDIAAGDLVPVEVDGLAILIAADLDGKIFGIANSCPHLGTPLENGRYANWKHALGNAHEIIHKHNNLINIFIYNIYIHRLGEGSTIVCPLHKSAFSLETGTAL